MPVPEQKPPVSTEAALPENCVKILHAIFDIQDEFGNESKFAAYAVEAALVNYAKYRASQVVAEYERSIAKVQKARKEFNRTQAIEFLHDTRSGKAQEGFAVKAEALKKALS